MDLIKIDLNIDKYLLGSILCIENVIISSGLSCVSLLGISTEMSNTLIYSTSF